MADVEIVKEQLQTAFEFNDEDLELNRSGSLSTKQKKLLEKTRQMRGCGRQAAVWGLGGTAGLFAVLFIYLLATGRITSVPAMLAIGAVLAVFVLLAVVAFVADFLRGRDLKTGRISVVEGKASQHKQKKVRGNPGMVGDFIEYYVRIGGKRIRLQTPQQLEALRGEGVYRLFYVRNPPVDIVLSVEEI